jgi:hypothetical protein
MKNLSINTNNIKNTGYLTFGNVEAKQNLLSLSKVEKKEFEVDLAELLKKTHEKLLKDNFFEVHHLINQKLGDRYFRVELWVDFSPEKKPVIVLQQFKEITLDNLLYLINADENLKNEGYTT